MRSRFRRAALAAATVLSVSSTAGAQELVTGYAASSYQPSDRGSRWFALDSINIEGDGRIALGVVGDYAYRSIVRYSADDSREGSVLRHQLYLHPSASFVFADRVRLGVNIPLQIYADGEDQTIGNKRFLAPQDQVAVGDVRFGLDVRALGAVEDAFRLSLGAQVFVPSGSPAAFTGDGEPRFLPRVQAAGNLGDSIAYAARVGIELRGLDREYSTARVGTNVVYGASIGWLFADKKALLGPELFGNTVVSKGDGTSPIEALLGLHYDVGSTVRLGVAGGTGVSRAIGAPVLRTLLSLEWVPGDAPRAPEPKPDDKDGDGIVDAEDACMYAPGPKSDDKTLNGCPIPDMDKDGIPDKLDACPCAPGPASEDPARNGCPAPNDKDGDGVVDGEDACPDAPGPRTQDAKTNGCPVVTDNDRDKDGIANDVDACPDAAGPADPDPKKNGCPKAVLVGNKIEIKDSVKFATGSAEITGKESDDVLKAVADIMKAHPEIAKVRVEGHTDAQGDPAANKTLSQNRAASVVAWLVKNGIDQKRLTSAGFGQEKPLTTNDTDAGRATNRRVEFHVEEKP